jgi:hypothetical protein
MKVQTPNKMVSLVLLSKLKLQFPDASPTSTADSSLTNVSTAILMQSEEDGLTYIAGYLAKKHQKKFLELGCYTYKKERINLHSYRMPS